MIVTAQRIVFFKEKAQETSKEGIFIAESAQHAFSQCGEELHYYQVVSTEKEERKEGNDKEDGFLSAGTEKREENEGEEEKRYGNSQKRGSKKNRNTREQTDDT